MFNSVAHDANIHSLFASFVCCLLFSGYWSIGAVVYYVVCFAVGAGCLRLLFVYLVGLVFAVVYLRF